LILDNAQMTRVAFEHQPNGRQESETERKLRHIEELRAEFVDQMGISEEDADKWLQPHRDEIQIQPNEPL